MACFSGDIYEILTADLEKVSTKEELLIMKKKLKDCMEGYKKSLVGVVERLSEKDKKSLYDAFAEEGSPDNRCYYMEDSIDDYFCEMSFSEAIRQIEKDEFDIDDEAFWMDKESSRLVSGTVKKFLDEHFDAEEIADWILDSRNAVVEDNEEIDEWVNEYVRIDDRISEIEDYLIELECVGQ